MTGPTVVPGVVASVEIPTTQTKLSVGSTLALQAKVYDGSRNSVVDKSVFWTSSDSAIAKVSREGVVTGIGAGPVRIAASVQGRSAVANLTVTPRAVASILVNPPSPNILVGGTLQLSSVTLGESGDVLADRPVLWQSSNPLVATIDNFGLLTGLAAGVTTITATSESRNASVGVTVLPVPVANVQISPALDTVVVGQTTQLTAVPRDSIGAPLTDRPVAWSSSNQSVASVSASGLVVGAQAGTVTITSSSEGKTGTAKIVVLARPVGAVIVSPAQVSINAGQTLKLTVLITDNNGTLLNGRPIQYKSGNTSIATVALDGTVTGVNEGSTTITVTSEGKTGSADVDVAASPIATVRINAPVSEMAIGATQKLTVTLLDASGTTLPARPIAWRSGASSVATIANDGTVTAMTAGTVIIFATVDGKLASVTLTVRSIAVISVVVAPPTANMFVGDALDLGAQPRDVGGAVIAGRVIAWTSSDDRIAVVSSSGRVRALAAGQVLITATVDGVHGSSAITTQIESVLSVTVDPPALSLLPGTSSTLTPTARGRNGAALTGRTFTFVSADPSVASVNSSGLVNALKTGTTSITVSSEGRQVIVPITVDLAPVATVTVSLANNTRYVSQTTQATTDMRDASNNILTGRPVVWTSSNSGVATVSTTGVVTAVAPGTANIIASSGGKSGQAQITVSLVPVSSVNVTLTSPARFVGQTTPASAVTLDSIGGVLTGRAIVWTSSNSSVATVSTTGVVSALAPGTANIIATSEGKAGSAPVTVTLVPVAKVVVSLAAPTRFVGQTTQATITLYDANDNVLTGRVIALSTSDASIATISNTGLVTTVAPGVVDIIATSETKTGVAQFTVTQPPVATVAVTLQQPARFTGQTTQTDVVLRDPLNRVLTGRVITYTSSDPNIATVSTSGLVTAVAPGTASITATSEGISGSATVTVSLIPVSTVAVTVTQSALQPGQTSQATAVTRDVNGVILNGRVVTWVSTNPSVATVSPSGLITAVAPGNTNVTATSEGVSTSVPITVTLIPVAAVSVSIDKPSIFIGYTAQVTSTTRDANNNILTGRLTTWASSDQNVATVSANGVVTGNAKGTATITGTSEGISGTVQITVDIAPVEFVTIAVVNTSLLVGQSTQSTVSTSDINNRVLNGRIITYQSSNSNVATVNQNGLVVAVGGGSANIIATSEGKSGFVTVTVATVPVGSVSVSLSGNGNSLLVGGTIQAVADVRDANNNVLTGRVVTWVSADPSVATVDANGLVTGVGAGGTTITATSEGKSGSTIINVTLAPVASVTVTIASPTIQILQTTQANVVLRDANNHVLTGRVVTYQSSNPLVAAIGGNGGILGVLPGTATITATSEGISGTATITVSLVPVSSVDVTLANNSVVAGNTDQATAVTRDAFNNVLTGRTVTWSSSSPGVASVDVNGLVTTIAAGVADITATSEGKSGFATLTVTPVPPAPVATVSVSLSQPSVDIGQSSQASAVTRDAANAILSGRVIAWSSTNSAVATVDAAGLVTTLSAGTADITATSEGKSGFATLTVTVPPPAPVATVSVSLNAPTVVAGQTTQANATTRDAANTVLTGRVVTWASSNAAVATVDAAGLVTTLTAGTTDITATSEGKSGFATLTVTAPPPAPVANVNVSLSLSSVTVGATSQATAALTDANNNVLTGRVITWSTSDPTIATVDANGLVTTLKDGSVTVTAMSEGKTGSAPLTVTLVPVANVAVLLASPTVTIAQTTQATAVLTDANGGTLTGRTIVWSSSDNNIATVSPTGVVTAVAQGSATITATAEGKVGSAVVTVP